MVHPKGCAMNGNEKRSIHLHSVRSLAPEIQRIFQKVHVKADEYCSARGSIYGYEVDDWLLAERALIEKPTIQLNSDKDAFIIKIDLPDRNLPELKVQITGNQVLVTSGLGNDGRQLFRLVTFPEAVDPASIDVDSFDNSLQIVVRKLPF